MSELSELSGEATTRKVIRQRKWNRKDKKF